MTIAGIERARLARKLLQNSAFLANTIGNLHRQPKSGNAPKSQKDGERAENGGVKPLCAVMFAAVPWLRTRLLLFFDMRLVLTFL